MLCIEFTDEERKALHYERFHHPHPRVQQKMEALWLKSHNLPHAQIAALVQVSEETLRSYLRAYQKGGIDKLKTLSWRGPESELSQHQSTLKDFFLQNPPATVARAAEQIKKLTGIERKPSQVRKFLKHLSMKPRKMAAIPAKADPQVQQEFLKKN